MPRTYVAALMVLTAVSIGSFAGPASAQSVNWRRDYAAARKESKETGRPLLLDFGTESCFWCKKLDATTFRDPSVIRLLNEQFIPVKIDGNKDVRLTESMNVDAYPALIVATAEGKVVGRHGGFADVGQMTSLLKKAATPPAAASAIRPSPIRPAPTAIHHSEAADWRKPLVNIEADLAVLHNQIAADLSRSMSHAAPSPANR